MDAVTLRRPMKTVEIESRNIHINQRFGLIKNFQPS